MLPSFLVEIYLGVTTKGKQRRGKDALDTGARLKKVVHPLVQAALWSVRYSF
jgi:hypothetical protein